MNTNQDPHNEGQRTLWSVYTRPFKMSEKEFMALIAWYRTCSDMDWKDIDTNAINSLIDRECTERGYKSWAHVPGAG